MQTYWELAKKHRIVTEAPDEVCSCWCALLDPGVRLSNETYNIHGEGEDEESAIADLAYNLQNMGYDIKAFVSQDGEKYISVPIFK